MQNCGRVGSSTPHFFPFDRKSRCGVSFFDVHNLPAIGATILMELSHTHTPPIEHQRFK